MYSDATGSVEITDVESLKAEAWGHTDDDHDDKCDICGEVLKAEDPTDGTTEAPTVPQETEKPDEEIPKTGSNDTALYLAMMVIAIFGILCTVILSKKKYEE
jgi:LPXTG-motif cell wall-anchored protein